MSRDYPADPIHEARLRGFGEGWAARQPEIDRLNDEADRLYLRAYNGPADVKRIHGERLTEHFREEDRRFFGGAA